MFAKLLLVVVVMGTTACGLLVNRQQRIETAHETVSLHQQILEQRQAVWALRWEIASRSRPDELRLAVKELEETLVPYFGGEAVPYSAGEAAKHAHASSDAETSLRSMAHSNVDKSSS